MAISLDTKFLDSFIKPHELGGMQPLVNTAHQMIVDKSGLGSDFLGWVDLPSSIDPKEVAQVKKTADRIRKICDVLLVIGIGGSYLGSRAAIEYIKSPFYNSLKTVGTPEIYFVGNTLSPSYLNEILTLCDGKDICLNIISKSGTTTEPALAFRVLRELLVAKYGEEGSKERIICTTDKEKGTLKQLADSLGYETFVIPDDVGGRFSVLTPVGLLPIAVAGIDIDQLLAGAKQAQADYSSPDLESNPCYKYAALRNILLRKNKAIEVLVSYEPAFTLMNEWYKQLFGESEGKDGKGLFPASMVFSTDLHSLGQFVQDGNRNLFETIINIESSPSDITVKSVDGDFDGLNFLSGMEFSDINTKAMQGTILAHTEGGTPNIIINVPARDEHSLGMLMYFFEKACAISGYMLGVNPFDQPGVEDYKKNMFALLGKPGFEDRRAQLEAKL